MPSAACDADNALRIFVWDLYVELILESHDDLHHGERIGAEIVREGRVTRNRALLNTECRAITPTR